jgi:hypothetical protein
VAGADVELVVDGGLVVAVVAVVVVAGLPVVLVVLVDGGVVAVDDGVEGTAGAVSV